MIPLFKVAMDPAIGPAIDRVLQSGFIAQGPAVDAFEMALVPWTGRRPVTVNSCTSALTLALRMLGLNQGDEIISTPMTCSATNLPIMAFGAKIVWADIDPRTGLIDPGDVARKVTARTRAVIAVDWGGQPADYDALRLVTAGRGIKIIEDAAHAFGASYRGRALGLIADYTAFSFQAIKHLTTGDGGALVVPVGHSKRARNLRWFGIDREAETEFRGETDIPEWGYKFHMNDIAATIGLANLVLVGGVLARHRANAEHLNEHLDERFTRTTPEYRHVGSWWIYTTLLKNRDERDRFKKWMTDRGVQVSQVHWRNDKLSCFAQFRDEHLPGVDEFSSRMICLPVHLGAPAIQVAAAANSFFS